jgi:hypothetical protein
MRGRYERPLLYWKSQWFAVDFLVAATIIAVSRAPKNSEAFVTGGSP